MMADTALDKQQDSRKPERACAWCGADISHRRWSAKFCSSRCKDFGRYESRHGHPPGPFSEDRRCEVCGSAFTARTATRRYCDPECRGIAQREMGREENTKRARRYREQFPERYREYDKNRRAADPEMYRARDRARYRENLDEKRRQARERYNVDPGQSVDACRERRRRRAAEAALSMLILPIEEARK